MSFLSCSIWNHNECFTNSEVLIEIWTLCYWPSKHLSPRSIGSLFPLHSYISIYKSGGVIQTKWRNDFYSRLFHSIVLFYILSIPYIFHFIFLLPPLLYWRYNLYSTHPCFLSLLIKYIFRFMYYTRFDYVYSNINSEKSLLIIYLLYINIIIIIIMIFY